MLYEILKQYDSGPDKDNDANCFCHLRCQTETEVLGYFGWLPVVWDAILSCSNTHVDQSVSGK